MKEKVFDRMVLKRIIVLFCLLAAIVSMYACDSEKGSPESSYIISEESTESTEYMQDYGENEVEETRIVETEPQMIGIFTIEDLANEDGFFVKYPDGSFDKYRAGTEINWGQPEYYTYGTEWCPTNIVLSTERDSRNIENLKKGALVFKTSQNEKVMSGIYPVVESGFAMSGVNIDGIIETLFWLDEKGNDFWVVDGTKIEPQYQYHFSRLRDIISINGVEPGTVSIFEKEENKTYVTLQQGDVFVIGEAEGTALKELEYVVDRKYYLSTLNFWEKPYEYSEDYYPLELQPTTDGYAIVDFSNIPDGDYIITYSYWSEKTNTRWAYMIHICIE